MSRDESRLGAEFELLDPDERIAVSLDCATCGYDLRGRRLSENCSECATPVRVSTDAAELRIVTPERARRFRGCVQTFRAIMLMALVMPNFATFGFGSQFAFIASACLSVALPTLLAVAALLQDAPGASPKAFTVRVLVGSILFIAAALIVLTDPRLGGEFGAILLLFAGFECCTKAAARAIARVTIHLEHVRLHQVADVLFGGYATALFSITIAMAATMIMLGVTTYRAELGGITEIGLQVCILTLLIPFAGLLWVRALFIVWWCNDILSCVRRPPSAGWLRDRSAIGDDDRT